MAKYLAHSCPRCNGLSRNRAPGAGTENAGAGDQWSLRKMWPSPGVDIDSREPRWRSPSKVRFQKNLDSFPPLTLRMRHPKHRGSTMKPASLFLWFAIGFSLSLVLIVHSAY